MHTVYTAGQHLATEAKIIFSLEYFRERGENTNYADLTKAFAVVYLS